MVDALTLHIDFYVTPILLSYASLQPNQEPYQRHNLISNERHNYKMVAFRAWILPKRSDKHNT